VIFILATTEIRKVPVTILSRCQRFDLARVPVETLKKHFAWVAAQEKISLSDEANELLARAADGSVRDGLSLLDQAIAQTGGQVDEGAVLDMLKRTDRGTVVNFMKTVLSGDTSAALNKLDEIYANGADLTMLLNDMMEWTHWATRMYPSLRLQDATSSPYTADQRETIKKINETISLNTLSRIWQVMVAAVPELQASSNQKQCFDMLVIRLMHIADLPSISEILKQNSAPEPKPVPQQEKPDTPQESKYIDIKNSNELVNALQSTRELLLYSYVSSNLEIIEFESGKIKYFDRQNDKNFAQKLSVWLRDNTGKTWTLEITTDDPHKETISEHKKAEIASDPMVASAMDLFEDAEIVNISK
jgi:DNA polymerase-3 subunit gamma/tau